MNIHDDHLFNKSVHVCPQNRLVYGVRCNQGDFGVKEFFAIFTLHQCCDSVLCDLLSGMDPHLGLEYKAEMTWFPQNGFLLMFTVNVSDILFSFFFKLI